MRKLGQHFLKNKSALRLIAGSLDLAADDIVIEIGPGHGELTEFLAATSAKKIIAIERDEGLFLPLTQKFANDARVMIVHSNALELLPRLIQNSELEIRRYKIAGNIPYYITGHLFRVVSELVLKPALCSLTVQKEVAERICASPPHMNRLAASVQFWASAKIIKTLPASDFSPPPRIASAILVLTTSELGNMNADRYYATVRALFAQPRKTLLNNLVKAVGQTGDVVAKKLSASGIVPGCRPQNLKVSDILMITKMFF
jgi:16S rRNA (adenine1518-N6/adenine1519-N6)-dimethyltransferase